jgi:tRNA/rRNA methyltransferase
MNSMELNQVRIVLVEPAGARNVGSIARVMTNMGLRQLVIVNPQCDLASIEALHMAVHGQQLLRNCAIVPDLPTALWGCQRVVGTTFRQDDLPRQPQSPSVALAWLLEIQEPTALVFGREDNGLSNQELDYAQRYLRIPVSPAYTSLNLAQAVGICAYELWQLSLSQRSSAVLPMVPELAPNLAPELATVDQLDRYYQQLETLLLDIGYLQTQTAPSRMAKLRRLYGRAELSRNELALLRGICRQMSWALSQPAERATPPEN